MENREIILNLWHVGDNDGLIYSLRAKPYVFAGTDEEKLSFLQERASLDFLVARPFEIPPDYHTTIEGQKMPVFPAKLLQNYGGPIPLTDLFESIFREIEDQFPAQTQLTIPEDPLVCLTPLIGDENGILTS